MAEKINWSKFEVGFSNPNPMHDVSRCPKCNSIIHAIIKKDNQELMVCLICSYFEVLNDTVISDKVQK
jgi:formylmethanofuran dehydrogenase subunit E